MTLAFRRCGNRPCQPLTNYVTLSCAFRTGNESFRRAAPEDGATGGLEKPMDFG